MSDVEIKQRLESSLSPLRCVFSASPLFSKRITFRLRDGVGRETNEFAFAVGEMQDEAGFEAAVEHVRHSVERNGFRHRR